MKIIWGRRITVHDDYRTKNFVKPKVRDKRTAKSGC